MFTDFTAGAVKKEFFTTEFYAVNSSPVVCFGKTRKFLEYMTHNIIRGEYVS
jgi:hypothetical protein